MAAFQSVAKVSEIGPGTMKLVNFAGDEVVIANVNGSLCAFGNECTHAGGPLVEGELAGDTVTCPWHATVFNVRSGEPQSGPGHDPISTYDVRVAGEEIQVAKR